MLKNQEARLWDIQSNFPWRTSISFDYAQDKYRALDTVYSTTKMRKDTISTLRLSYVLGLESFAAPNGTEPYMQFSAKYSSAKSNIANFTKYSGDASVTVTKPF